MGETIIKIEHVSKEYRLGAIGGGTLRGDLQSFMARLRGKEDPNTRIGQDVYTSNQRFLALDDVSFSVEKGERVGIIGHNGAGKSTLLKLLSRVTAPTTGTISYNGRIASMLEVGTGFHPELTGRENIYLNGAILGMSKAEITEKFDDIVAFAEMEKFVDTPVKRYSSGMYVKLAFAVAAHLDADILVMDEVLAVGDMKFQQKCLGKMDDVSKSEGKTVLYVSHNMNTIRQLCTRCIVLDHGKVIFDGDVEAAIGVYMGYNTRESVHDILVGDATRSSLYKDPPVRIHRIIFENKTGVYQVGERLNFSLHIKNTLEQSKNVDVRIVVNSEIGHGVTMSMTEKAAKVEAKEMVVKDYLLDISNLVPGKYSLAFVLTERGELGVENKMDSLQDIYNFSITEVVGFNHDMPWQSRWWGYVCNGYIQEVNRK